LLRLGLGGVVVLRGVGGFEAIGDSRSRRSSRSITFGLVFSVSTEHKRPNFTNKPHFYSTELLLILSRYTLSIMPHKKRFTKGTAKMEALRVSKSDRQQIPPAIRSAATVMSEISGNSLLSIGKSLDLMPNTVHYIVKDAEKKAEDNNRKLLDQRNFEDVSRSDRSCIRTTALSLSQRLIRSENRASRP